MSRKIAAVLYLVAAMMFWIASAIRFCNGETMFGIVYFCLGLTVLSLSMVYFRKKP